jgi:hypothetical protein
MAGRRPQRARKPERRVCLEFDRLETLQLLSTGSGVHHSLGSFIAPSVISPRISQPVQVVDAHQAINTYMASIFGSQLQPIQQAVENQNTSRHSTLVDRVLGDAFVHTTLSDQDTYTLLNSGGMNTLIGFGQVPDTATYLVSPSDVLSVGDPNSVVSIPSSGGLPGFVVTVPTANIRTLSSGQVAVLVPLSSIPSNAPPPAPVSELNGELSTAFSATGSLIFSALQTGLPLRAPNAPRTVPGLRLARAISNDRFLPLGSTHLYLRMFRVAVERGVFELDANQTAQVQTALQQFNAVANGLNQAGTLTPPVPPAAPSLPSGPLGGTLEVSTGALRNLVNVAPGLTGLPLPVIGNFPGRMDVGYVFARNGDYGLVLTLRGPLYPSPSFPPVDNIGGTIRIEASNARSLSSLNGLRTVEGLSIGTALMGTVQTSRTASGVSTFATSAGYGAGMEYGTGIAYTQVIPLGNLNALIPQAPPQR